MLCQRLGRAVLGQARSVARPGQARLAVEGRAPRVVYQLVLLVLLVVILQDIPVQADGVPVEPEQGVDQGAEVALPLLRRGSRVKTKVIPYQAGDSGMG